MVYYSSIALLGISLNRRNPVFHGSGCRNLATNRGLGANQCPGTDLSRSFDPASLPHRYTKLWQAGIKRLTFDGR